MGLTKSKLKRSKISKSKKRVKKPIQKNTRKNKKNTKKNKKNTRKNSVFGGNVQDEECSICHNTFKNSVVFIPNCGHIFHVSCINTWCIDKNPCPCPMCRGVIDLTPIHDLLGTHTHTHTNNHNHNDNDYSDYSDDNDTDNNMDLFDAMEIDGNIVNADVIDEDSTPEEVYHIMVTFLRYWNFFAEERIMDRLDEEGINRIRQNIYDMFVDKVRARPRVNQDVPLPDITNMDLPEIVDNVSDLILRDFIDFISDISLGRDLIDIPDYEDYEYDDEYI